MWCNEIIMYICVHIVVSNNNNIYIYIYIYVCGWVCEASLQKSIVGNFWFEFYCYFL